MFGYKYDEQEDEEEITTMDMINDMIDIAWENIREDRIYEKQTCQKKLED